MVGAGGEVLTGQWRWNWDFLRRDLEAEVRAACRVVVVVDGCLSWSLWLAGACDAIRTGRASRRTDHVNWPLFSSLGRATLNMSR